MVRRNELREKKAMKREKIQYVLSHTALMGHNPHIICYDKTHAISVIDFDVRIETFH